MSLEHLSRAHDRNELWPTIADAVDTFWRRRGTGADSYERIWRLIHVWEALSITLACAAMARMRVTTGCAETFLRCREHCYGSRWNQVTRQFDQSQGALQGSIDKWIEILQEAARLNVDDGYLASLGRFLNTEGIQLAPLIDAWSLACDAPKLQKTSFTVRESLKHINTLRNRFAHVPFPHDPIDSVADNLERVTDKLFSLEPTPWSIHRESLNSSLIGAFVENGHRLVGTLVAQQDRGTPDEPSAAGVFMVHPGQARPGVEQEAWSAEPFVYIDAMMRPYILTRLRNEEVPTWEYTRFRAEAHALVTVDDRKRLGSLEPPNELDYPIDAEDRIVESESRGAEPHETLGQVATFSEAMQAMRSGKFDRAIGYFEDLTRRRPRYHIGWLRLGVARREKAVRLESDAEARALLSEAVKDLERAGQHIAVDYQAQAHYERSKAYFRLAQLLTASERKEAWARALESSREANTLSSDPKYATWMEHLERLGT